MHKRTLAGALGVDTVAGPGRAWLLSHAPCCARAGGHLTPTRTPRPTWTPASMAFQVATPTIDATRYPAAAADEPGCGRTGCGSTPQVFVPGGNGPIFVPVQPGSGAVQTVVVVIVTATPPPAPDVHAGSADLATPANIHAWPADGHADRNGHATAAGDDKGQGGQVQRAPGTGNAVPCRHQAGCGHERNCCGTESDRRLVEDLLRERAGRLDRRFGGRSNRAYLGCGGGDQYPTAAADRNPAAAHAHPDFDADILVADQAARAGPGVPEPRATTTSEWTR